MILDVNHLYTSYGLSQILFDVSLTVEEGECVSLLGRNGVGKTTTLRSIMGLTPPRQGQVLYKGQDITGKAAFRIAQMGLGFVPEDRRIFPDLTVRENLDVARKPPKSTHTTVWTAERVYELFPVLANLENRKGGYLSGGEQQMLTIGRPAIGVDVHDRWIEIGQEGCQFARAPRFEHVDRAMLLHPDVVCDTPSIRRPALVPEHPSRGSRHRHGASGYHVQGMDCAPVLVVDPTVWSPLRA